MGSSVPARHLLFVLVCLVATACGNSGDDTSGAAPATTTTTAASGTTAAATQACADAAALKASVAELDQLDPAQAGKAGIQAALDKVPGQPGRAQGQRHRSVGQPDHRAGRRRPSPQDHHCRDRWQQRVVGRADDRQ